MVHVKPHAIVLDKKDIFTSILPAPYLDLGVGTRACEFDGLVLLIILPPVASNI
jgi:hypothetical protein